MAGTVPDVPPEPGDDTVPCPGEVDDDRPGPTPVQRFLERHRTVAGTVMTVLAAAVGLLFAWLAPGDVEGTGARALVLRWASPACWTLISIAALTWTLRRPRSTTNAVAYAALACYVVYLVVRAF